jgi:AcrR family transcriptional regulator
VTARRTQQKQENRAKLMAAARKVFAEKGLGASTARDIVRETDLATGTFYNYFDDKEDCFRAVLDEFTQQARIAAHEKRIQPGVQLEDRIWNAYRAYFELVVADPEMFEVLRRNADAIAMLGAEDMFAEAVDELVEDMAQWVTEGQVPAAVKPWLTYIARSIAGGGFQVAAQMADEGMSDIDAAADFCTRLLLNGLRGYD